MLIRKIVFSITLAVLAGPSVSAAEVKNLKVSQVGETAVATYDLIGGNGEQSADVLVSISINGDVRTSDQLHLTGALGKEVPLGTGKRISWEVTKDLPADFDWDKGEFNWNVAVPPPVKATQAGSAPPPGVLISNAPEPVKLWIRDTFETAGEYAKRIEELPYVLIGKASVSVSNYSVDSGSITLPIMEDSWAKPYLDQNSIRVSLTPATARLLVMGNDLINLYSKFKFASNKIVIQDFVLGTSLVVNKIKSNYTERIEAGRMKLIKRWADVYQGHWRAAWNGTMSNIIIFSMNQPEGELIIEPISDVNFRIHGNILYQTTYKDDGILFNTRAVYEKIELKNIDTVLDVAEIMSDYVVPSDEELNSKYPPNIVVDANYYYKYDFIRKITSSGKKVRFDCGAGKNGKQLEIVFIGEIGGKPGNYSVDTIWLERAN